MNEIDVDVFVSRASEGEYAILSYWSRRSSGEKTIKGTVTNDVDAGFVQLRTVDGQTVRVYGDGHHNRSLGEIVSVTGSKGSGQYLGLGVVTAVRVPSQSHGHTDEVSAHE